MDREGGRRLVQRRVLPNPPRERGVELVHAAELRRRPQESRANQALEIDQAAGPLALADLVERDRLERERAALARPAQEERVERRDRPGMLATLEQGVDVARLADLEQALEQGRLEADRALVGGERLVEPLQRVQHGAEAVVDLRLARP